MISSFGSCPLRWRKYSAKEGVNVRTQVVDRGHTIVHERNVTHVRDDTNYTVMCGMQDFTSCAVRKVPVATVSSTHVSGCSASHCKAASTPLETTTHQGTPARQTTFRDTGRIPPGSRFTSVTYLSCSASLKL